MANPLNFIDFDHARYIAMEKCLHRFLSTDRGDFCREPFASLLGLTSNSVLEVLVSDQRVQRMGAA
jgi:hypothetical protein